jgi:hypothetical protein
VVCVFANFTLFDNHSRNESVNAVSFWCRKGISRSAFARLNLGRFLGAVVTWRNWNTVIRLGELAGAGSARRNECYSTCAPAEVDRARRMAPRTTRPSAWS